VGVERFVFTTRIMVVWGYSPPQWAEGDAPPRPVGTYAVTTQIGESMCRYYAESFGLSVVCLRIPKPVDLADAKWRQWPIRPQWLAFPDLVDAYRLALAAPGIGFEIVTVVGESSGRR
jgi:uronate dehydrogenase